MILKKLNKSNNSLKKRITLKKTIHGGNKNNNSVKKRISMKKMMHGGSIFTNFKDFLFGKNDVDSVKEDTGPLLDENFIIKTYFTKPKVIERNYTRIEGFHLKRYPNMYNNDNWNNELLTKFIDVYNSFFTRLYVRVLFMEKPQIEIEKYYDSAIERNVWDNLSHEENPGDILDNLYIGYLLRRTGFIYATPEILNIMYELYYKNDDDCGIKRVDKYYKIYDETIGQGGFGTLFKCTKNKVIKFIDPLCIMDNSYNRLYSPNGINAIRNIVSFLNEIIILITLNYFNDVLFKKPHSFGYKNIPEESIHKINDGPREIKGPNEDDIDYFEVPLFPGKFYIIMDNMGETLENKLTGTTKIDTKVKLQYLKNLVDGLSIIHENNFCHFDIKSINILVGEDNIARFIDFGISKLITNTGTQWYGSTPDWTPPQEYKIVWPLRGAQLLNVDIYQLGLIFYFVLLEDKNFLKDRPIGDKTVSDDVYRFFNDKVEEKVMKTDENADILKFYMHITNFIRNNEMLNFENFKIVPEPDSECRMKTIKQNFEQLYKIFVKDSRSRSRSRSNSRS